LLCAPTASGQDIEGVSFETVDWVFVPAVAENGEIFGFLSWTDTALIGQNVSLLWYEYDENDGSFTTFAWKHPDVGAAALWLRGDYSEEMMFVHNDELPDFIAVADAANITAPKPFTNGLFEDDPLAPVIESADNPQIIIDALASIGYEAAPSISGMIVATGESGSVQVGQNPVPIDVACVVAAGSLEAMMLNDLYNRTKSFVDFGIDLPGNRSCSWPCTCTTTVIYTPTGPWVGAPSPVNPAVCLYSRPSTRTTTKTGDTWFLCVSCASTTTWRGTQSSNELGPDWPAEPLNPDDPFTWIPNLLP